MSNSSKEVVHIWLYSYCLLSWDIMSPMEDDRVSNSVKEFVRRYVAIIRYVSNSLKKFVRQYCLVTLMNDKCFDNRY